MVTIYFFYGLSFFALGLALLVRAVPSGIKSLRPSLKWLCAFALLHAAHEWLVMSALSGALADGPALSLSTAIIGGISFVALLAAGLYSFPNARRLPPRVVTSVLVTFTSIWSLLLVAEVFGSTAPLPAEVFARFFLGGPGGLLLGLGFILQARSRLRSGAMATTVKRKASPLSAGFFGAGFAVAGYGLMTFPGPSLDIFPLSTINALSFFDLFGLPIQVLRAVLAGLAAASVVAILKSFHAIDLEDLELQVTERTEALNEMAKHLSKALVNEERANQAKSEFLATMSHELRTPLNAIMGFSEMMRLRGATPANDKTFKDYAAHIHDSGKHLLSLIDDVLQFSAIEAGQLKLATKPTKLEPVLDECIGILSLEATKKSIRMTTEVAEGLPLPMVDARAIKQVLLNVVGNAIKYTQPGGSVKVSLAAAGGEIVMRVADTGIGIPLDKISSVTEPFTRSYDDPYQTQDGIGLGLSIVKSLVEAHLGTLRIDSTLGQGTRVTIQIPIEGESSQQPGAAVAARATA